MTELITITALIWMQYKLGAQHCCAPTNGLYSMQLRTAILRLANIIALASE